MLTGVEHAAEVRVALGEPPDVVNEALHAVRRLLPICPGGVVREAPTCRRLSPVEPTRGSWSAPVPDRSFGTEARGLDWGTCTPSSPLRARLMCGPCSAGRLTKPRLSPSPKPVT